MAIDSISNREGAASIRSKLNTVIGSINTLESTTIPSIEGDIVDLQDSVSELSNQSFSDMFASGQIIPIKETKSRHLGLMSGIFMSTVSNKWVCWYRDGNTHGTDTTSTVKAMDSYDAGLTWVNERTIHSESSIDTRNGFGIVMDNNRFGLLMHRYDGSFLAPVFIYSDNEGVTWNSTTLSSMPNGGPLNLISYPTSVGGDDSQGFIGFYDNKSNGNIVAIYTINNGATWSYQTVLTLSTGLAGQYCVEPYVSRVGIEDKWIMVLRNQGSDNNTDHLNSRITKSVDLLTWSTTVLSGQEQGRNTGMLFNDGSNSLYYITTSRYSTTTEIEIGGDSYRNKMLYQKIDNGTIWADLTSWTGWKVMFSHANNNEDELLLEPFLDLKEFGGRLYGTFASKEDNTSKNYSSIYLFTTELDRNPNNSSYVDIGDNSTDHFTLSSLTVDGNYHVLDLSSHVPSNTKLVLLTILANSNTAGSFIRFRRSDFSNEKNASALFCQVAGVSVSNTFLCSIVDQEIEYKVFTSGSFTTLNINVKGYLS